LKKPIETNQLLLALLDEGKTNQGKKQTT